MGFRAKQDIAASPAVRLPLSCLVRSLILFLSCLLLFGALQNPIHLPEGDPGTESAYDATQSYSLGELQASSSTGGRTVAVEDGHQHTGELVRRRLGEQESSEGGVDGGGKADASVEALPVVNVGEAERGGQSGDKGDGESVEPEEDAEEVWKGGGKGGFDQVGTSENSVQGTTRHVIDETDPALRRQKARLDWIVEHLKMPPGGWPPRNKTEPTGRIYHDAGRFRATYRSMEKYLRIYIYSERNHPLTHTATCKDIYAIDGIIFNNLAPGHKFVTVNQTKANLFFIPVSFVNLVTYLWNHEQNYDSMRNYVRAYINAIASRHNYWNRTGGADHFMLTCHDWGPHISEAHDELASNAIRVMCNAKENVTMVPGKDLGLPEINLRGKAKLIDPRTLGGPPPEQRHILAFFAGADHGTTRPVLFKYWLEKDNDVRVYNKIPEEVAKQMSYDDHMKNSKFCLCPAGFEVNSPRIVEAIYNDCVPVIIADGFRLPFSDTLDWSKFSLRVPEASIPDLKRILLAVPEAEYVAMQKNLRSVRGHFVINQPAKRYDVFHMILHSLWLQRLKLHESGRI